MIPKKIHYIWLGGKAKDRNSMICINSWKRNLPDYEIIEWNEEKLDMNELMKNKFFKECYKKKLWAFMSDYIRLVILYNEGGIYLDTDVEVIKNFDKFLDDKMFVGYEANEYIGTGIIGAEKGNLVIKKIIEFYEKEIWEVDYYNNPIIFTNVLKSNKLVFKDCSIYPENYFSPYNPQNKHDGVVDNNSSVTIHWYNGSWGMSRKGYVFLQTKHIRNPIIKMYQILRKNIGYYKKKNTIGKF